MAGIDYLEALWAAGATEVVVGRRPLDPGAADALLLGTHGLLLLGGPDVDPAAYGQEPHERTYGVDPAQDAFERALLDAAGRTGRPVLAICRGLQLVNVAFGGSLAQHLEDAPDRLSHAPEAFPTPAPGTLGALLAADVPPGSRLHRLLATGDDDEPTAAPAEALRLVGSHSHHQAVDRLGTGLRVVARADDGVVEALEHDDRWLVAVQWHPEETAGHDPTMQRLFAGFVKRAAVLVPPPAPGA